MKLKNFILLAALFASLSAIAQTKRENIDMSWRFTESDQTGAEAVTYNDKSWKVVDLPHDWDIYHAPQADAPMSKDGGYYPGGIGWYRKQLDSKLFDMKNGQTLKLHFEGVYQRCKVYVNGTLAATHAYGYTPFMVDITPYVKKGCKLVVAVRVDNSRQPNCRWYSGSGIYRKVWLERYDEGQMDDPRMLYIRTENIYGTSADGSHADSATVHITYADNLDEIRTFRNVELWSPEHPKLYDIKVGALTVKHGFRSFTFDADNGLVLNGKTMLINGACVHHDDGVLGAAAFDAAEIRKVRLMKEAGFNLIRTSHNLQTRAFLDACDSLGMMVIDESFDGWYSEKKPYDYHEVIDSCYQEDLTAMVLRDRNHPSIICWSIGNEVIERKEIKVIQTAQKFKNVILRYDKTRPVTEALCSWDNDWEIFDPHAAVLDIVGYNYMMHKAESDHERCPKRVMWQTESYPRDAFKNWKHTADCPYIIGDIVWTGLDYLGESGIGQFYYEGEPRGEHFIGKHFPFHGAYCGDVDMTGWRKPVSHYRDMLWNAKEGDKAIYMAVKEPDLYTNGTISETLWSVWPTWESWNWNGWEGKNIDVDIYTKAPAVKLYLNDQLVATKNVDLSTEYKATITMPYQPGTLRAVAVDANGNQVSETVIKTSGEPAAIRLTADKTTIKADGHDLSYITMEVVDKDGNIVPDASVSADVNVTGAATFMSAGSASFKDLEPLASPHVTTYKGRAIIVVRSKNKAGKATVSVTSSLAKANKQIVVRQN